MREGGVENEMRRVEGSVERLEVKKKSDGFWRMGERQEESEGEMGGRGKERDI